MADASRPANLYLRTFGGLSLENGGRPIVGAAAQRGRLAMLAVLASAGGRGVSRDLLLAMFWPEKDLESARGALRQGLYKLRQDAGEPELTIGTTELKLNPDVIGSDVCDFDAALKAGDVEEAVERYAGPLLHGIHLHDVPGFERWVERERERRVHQYRTALEQLAAAADAAGEYRVAADLLKRLAATDPLSAAFAAGVIKALVRTGDRPAAMQYARSYERLVRAELDIAPEPAVLALAQELGADASSPLPLPSERATAASPTVSRSHESTASVEAPKSVTHQGRWRVPFSLLLILSVVVLGSAFLILRARLAASATAKAANSPSAIAVLPFRNLSTDSTRAYFAAGLHDELETQLSKVSALTVIGGTSVMDYAGASAPPVKQIAIELGVGSVIAGSVQVSGDRLRVSVQLIDAATGAHLWADSYDRTLDDGFAIQAEVARQVVAAVGAVLTGDELRRLATAPTANAEAYRLYLQGRDYRNRPAFSRRDIEIAQSFFERALALDPSFALAHAALSEVHGLMFFFPSWDHTPARAMRQREEAETSLRLAPDLPQAHFASGIWHYRARRDYPRALDELQIALRGLPSNAEIWSGIGQVNRRMGMVNEAIIAHERTTQLAPRNSELFKELGVTYLWMHRYKEAVAAFDRALGLAPDVRGPALMKGVAYVHWQGQLDTLRAILAAYVWNPETAGNALTEGTLHLLHWERLADSMLQVSRTKARAGVFEGQVFFIPASLYAAWAHQLRGDGQAARTAFELARVFVDSALKERPDDVRLHAARGLALAGLGRRADALREAQWLRQSEAYREDKFQGVLLVADRARILAQVGEADAALDEIESLLRNPSQLSVHTLRLDPLWDPIRSHPRFRSLLSRYTDR